MIRHKTLEPHFHTQMYGLDVRLVEESDAEFILSLRTDEKLSRFIHDTSPSLQNQIDWIREYKKREANGEDYYFIFFNQEKPFGLVRIYAINWETKVYTAGSWICETGSELANIVATALIPRIIAFENLGLELEDAFDGVHSENIQVIKFDEMVGMKRTGEILDVKGKYYTYQLVPEDFYKNQKKLEKLLGLKR